MRFDALELALLILSKLRKLIAKIRRYDPKLANQLRDAGNSFTLNLGEGSRRTVMGESVAGARPGRAALRVPTKTERKCNAPRGGGAINGDGRTSR